MLGGCPRVLVEFGHVMRALLGVQAWRPLICEGGDDDCARPNSTRTRVARAVARTGNLSQPSRCSSSCDLHEGGMRLVEKRSVMFERAVVLMLRPARAGSIERFPTVIATRPAAPGSRSSV